MISSSKAFVPEDARAASAAVPCGVAQPHPRGCAELDTADTIEADQYDERPA